MAANCAIAGSTRIGARCMIGGCTCINGHIDIADDVVIFGFAMVLKGIAQKGQYGGAPARPAREWRREIGAIHRLGRLEQRLRELEQRAGIRHGDMGEDDGGEENA
jgi:UDP-3-O-[3-hydroxymyristoyl] glucosamine N-acyltransferase